MITDYEGVLFLDSDRDDDRADNRASRFHAFMHTTLSFSTEFEVGLHEIQIPYSWRNLKTKQYVAVFNREWCFGFYEIEPGCYYNVVDLIDRINTFFRNDSKPPPRLIYDPEFERIRLRPGTVGDLTNVEISMTKTLASMLGFQSKWFEFLKLPPQRTTMMRHLARKDFGLWFFGGEPSEVFELADTPVNLQVDCPRLFVSSSIVKHVLHESRELLRVIPTKNTRRFCEIDVITFTTPLFVPLAFQAFDRIEISITDSKEQELEFTCGNVIVVLELRRRRDAVL